MGRARWPAKRRGRARDTARKPRRAARAGGIDPERVVGALAGGRAPLTAIRLLRRLGGGRHELRALRRMLRQLEAEGRIEHVEGGWRAPRADGLVEADLFA